MYDETRTGRRFDGIEGAVAALLAWEAAAPDANGEVVRILAGPDCTAIEIIWRGTQTGPLNTLGGQLPPSGKRFEIWASMWRRWQNGKLIEDRHHLDILTRLSQLGVLPAPASV